MDTNHFPWRGSARLCSSPAGKETSVAAGSRRMERAAAAQQGTAISKCGGSVSFSLPALCLVPGAGVGFVGCLRIRDLVVNHFPHLRPFHSCPWDQRSSTLEPCMGTAPVRETATELHVRDGGRMSSVSRTLLLPLPPRKSLEGTTAASQKLTAKHKRGC